MDHRHFRDSEFFACFFKRSFKKSHMFRLATGTVKDRDGGPLIRDLCSADPGEQNLRSGDDGRSKMSKSGKNEACQKT